MELNAKLTAAGVQYVRGPILGIWEFAFPNGMKALILPDPGLNSTYVGNAFAIGSQDEQLGEEGMAHFDEHLFFKGSKDFDSRKGNPLELLLHLAGGESNAFTHLSQTCYYCYMPTRDYRLALAIYADRLRSPKLRESDRAPEAQVVLEEMTQRASSPVTPIIANLQAVALQYRQDRRPIIGTKEVVAGSTIAKVRRFIGKWYHPANLSVLVAGNVEIEPVLEDILDLYGNIPAKKRPAARIRIQEPPQEGERRYELVFPGDLQRLVVSYRAPEPTHPDWIPLEVLSAILGADGSKNSRLYKRLVESGKASECSNEVDWTYGFHSYIVVAKDVPVKEVETMVNEEVASLIEHGVTDDELAQVREAAERRHALAAGDAHGFIPSLPMLESIANWHTVGNYLERLRDVSVEDLQRVAGRYLRKCSRTVGIYTPKDDSHAADFPPEPMKVRLFPDPVLKEKAEAVTVFDASLRELAQGMLDVMYDKKGVGLAAPQVGVSKRLMVVDVTAGSGVSKPFIFVNPTIEVKEGEIISQEGCLSFPQAGRIEVKRARRIVVRYQDLSGKEQKLEAAGDLLCRAIQHEIDHLDGVVFIDRAVSPPKPTEKKVASRPLNVGLLQKMTAKYRKVLPSSAGKSFSEQIWQMKIDNGLTINILPRRLGTNDVRVNVRIAAGSMFEAGQKPNLARVVSELLTSGSKSFSKESMARRLASMGLLSGLDVEIDDFAVNITSRVSTPHLIPYLELLSDVLRRPRFLQEDLDEVKGVVAADLRRAAGTRPMSMAANILFGMIYEPGHVFHKRPFAEQLEALKALSRDEVARFHDEHYRPGGTVVTIVGDVADCAAVAMALASSAMFGDWHGWTGPKSVRERIVVTRPSPFMALSKTVRRHMERQPSVAVMMGAPLDLARTSPDFLSAKVVMNAIGGMVLVSRLGRRVREDLGLTYGINASVMKSSYGWGPWIVKMMTGNKTLEPAIDETMRILHDFAQNGITEDELHMAAGNEAGAFLCGIDNMSALAEGIGMRSALGVGFDELDNYGPLVESITLDRANEVVRRYFDPDRLFTVIAGSID